MGKYVVTITETLKINVEVEANSPEEAEQIVADEYHDSKHILTSENFVDVDFKANKTKKSEPEKIKVVLLEPGKIARVAEIDASLEGMQAVVGGEIDVSYLSDNSLLIHNREGKQNGLSFHRGIYTDTGKLIDVIAGTAFVCDDSGEDFKDLSDEKIERYLNKFKYPERFFNVGGEITGIKHNPEKEDKK